ncbi:MAG: hypothetical protein AAF696_22025 [Bacteroidota bacterium]
MKLKQTAILWGILIPLFAFLFLSCEDENMQGQENETLNLSGQLIFPHAGDIFRYDLASGNRDFFVERKGRQGPFFSPDRSFFVTNNWPGNNEGVAISNLQNGLIGNEFSLSSALLSDQLGVKVAPEAAYFSAIINPPLGQNPDLLLLDDKGEVKGRLDGDLIRYRGHIWDREYNLYFTGEILEGGSSGQLILAKLSGVQSSDFKIEVIRSFEGRYSDLPQDLSVSSDSKQICYAYNREIWLGSTSQEATDHRKCFEAVQTLARPVFSPDAAYIAMAMLNSSTSLRGDIHIAKIPESGFTQLSADGSSKLAGPNSDNSTWTSGGDSSMAWIE